MNDITSLIWRFQIGTCERMLPFVKHGRRVIPEFRQLHGIVFQDAPEKSDRSNYNKIADAQYNLGHTCAQQVGKFKPKCGRILENRRVCHGNNEKNYRRPQHLFRIEVSAKKTDKHYCKPGVFPLFIRCRPSGIERRHTFPLHGLIKG